MNNLNKIIRLFMNGDRVTEDGYGRRMDLIFSYVNMNRNCGSFSFLFCNTSQGCGHDGVRGCAPLQIFKVDFLYNFYLYDLKVTVFEKMIK